VGYGYTVEPDSADTVLVKVDIAPNAPSGELRIEIARSEDVAFTIGDSQGPPIGVVWERVCS